MRATVRLAKKHGVRVGAHPSLPDLQGFGRREMTMRRDELANCLIYQIGALKGFLEAEGMPLNHVKPHGSLYAMAARQEDVAAYHPIALVQRAGHPIAVALSCGNVMPLNPRGNAQTRPLPCLESAAVTEL